MIKASIKIFNEETKEWELLNVYKHKYSEVIAVREEEYNSRELKYCLLHKDGVAGNMIHGLFKINNYVNYYWKDKKLL